VVVRESYEFASAIAAERRGIPHVRVAAGLASTEEWLLGFAAAATGELPVAAIRTSPYLTLSPPAFEDPGVAATASTYRFRERGRGAVRPLPDWWDGATDPLVYVSFGSVAGALEFIFPRVYRAAIDALADVPARILVTTGNGGDPAELGPLPANVHAERWVAQADIAENAAVMVGHGGYGSTLGALLHGVPLVIVPLFADQGRNGRRVARLGAGIVLPELGSLSDLAQNGPAAVAAVGDAVRRILDNPRYLRAARGVAASAGSLPPVDTAPELLRGLAGLPALDLAS
jgi:UDP:flavonoid glycosyltransferase YjiC (YdhE family)